MNAQIQQIFHDVVDLTAEQRRRYFLERATEEEVQREVESLLVFAPDATRHLAEVLLTSVGQLLDCDQLRCGPWQVEKLLGRGGMGTVYLANREDGEVRQQAAVKLIQSGGVNLRERFLRERQILATLNHPYIARLLDAGHRADGQPFLVMEYIDGVPIDVFAENLPILDRVRLFRKVCDAVSHAHRNLVIHRDVKPSNILITATGDPKLLDFGIAKVLDISDHTQTVERFLTPGYSSPEQVSGGAIGTATDIYSLGAVLYRLLTGVSPHDPAADSTGAMASSDSWERIILEQEPKPPSAFNREGPRDLDFIAGKSLRKEPAERYSSVEQFSEDLGAFLESRPVRARTAGTWYRTRKFVRRNWVAVTVAALMAGALTAGLYTLNKERATAQRRFVQVRQLANKLFDIDAEVRRTPGTTGARQLIVDTALDYLQRLAPEARNDLELTLELGNAYMRVARVQGVPIGSNLGQMDNAEQSLRVADSLVESVLASQPNNRSALLRSAQINQDRSGLAALALRDKETLKLGRMAIDRMDKFLSLGKPNVPETQVLVITYQNVAVSLLGQEQIEEAIRNGRRAVDLARSAGLESLVGAGLSVLSNALRTQGNLDEALEAIDEAARRLEPPPGVNDLGRTNNFITALSRKGAILGDPEGISLGRTEEAVAVLERAFRMADEIAHLDPNDFTPRGRLATAGIRLGNVLQRSDPRRALAIYDHTLSRLAEVKNNVKARREEIMALSRSSYPLATLGRKAEAHQRLDAAFARLRQLGFYPAGQIELGSEADVALRALAGYETGSGNYRRAIEIYKELLDRIPMSKQKPETLLANAAGLSRIYAAMSPLYRQAGQVSDAVAVESRRLELWRSWSRQLPGNLFVQRQLEAARL